MNSNSFSMSKLLEVLRTKFRRQ